VTVARVLLVEDHATMRASLRAILVAEGHAVEEAVDGRAALEAIAAAPPDLVVLDLHVPVIDGGGVLAALRASPDTAGLPVIVVTATGEEERRATMALGADAYLTKPFGPPALLRLVAQVLPGGGRPAASP